MSKDSHKLEDVQTAVLAAALSNKGPDSPKYEEYRQNLVKQLEKSGEKIVKGPIPFYKKGVKGPAGYVIETDKEVLVCYHGTKFGKIFGSGGKEILHDLQISRAKMNFGGQKVSVHSGFKAEFESSKESLYQALAQTNLKDKGVHLTGHSLGGAVSQIAAMDLSTHFGVKVNKVTTFGGPRVFAKDAAELYNSKGLGDVTLRVKQDRDPVPRLVPRGMYHHTGRKITLKSSKRSIHSGAVYRDIATKKVTEKDIANARESDKPWSFTESYVKPVMRMTKAAFAIAYHSTIGAVVDKLKPSKSQASAISTPANPKKVSKGNEVGL
ncbi:MAG: lipase family protein [Rickettsiales bacterium]|nr:lipase family protein [Rickettsiales bacterium]MCA0254546.1 lipase family protein [Pseudomonadota bacterium]